MPDSDDDMAAMVDLILTPPAAEKPSKAAKPAPDDDDDAETPEAEDTADTGAEDDGEDADADEADEAADDADDADDADALPDLYTVKVDGEEQQVTLADLQRSYAGQAKIQRGMQEAAGVRKQAEATFVALRTEQTRVLQMYQQLQTQGVIPPPQPLDHGMAAYDPHGYVQALAYHNEHTKAYDAQQDQISYTKDQARRVQDAAMQAYQEEQAAILTRAIPDYGNPERAPAFMNRMLRAGKEYGYEPIEIANVVDSRAIRVLNDAARYQAIQAGKAKAKTAPTAPRTVKPGPHRAEPSQLARAKTIERARKTDTDEAWVNAILNQ